MGTVSLSWLLWPPSPSLSVVLEMCTCASFQLWPPEISFKISFCSRLQQWKDELYSLLLYVYHSELVTITCRAAATQNFPCFHNRTSAGRNSQNIRTTVGQTSQCVFGERKCSWVWMSERVNDVFTVHGVFTAFNLWELEVETSKNPERPAGMKQVWRWMNDNNNILIRHNINIRFYSRISSWLWKLFYEV